MTIPEIIKQAHENAVRRGFYICRDCGGKVCNQCNNFSAAKLNVYHDIKKELEEFINSTPCDTFHKDSEQSEIADMILILLAYCGEMKIDIESAIIEKMKYNATREYKHGKKY
jgi:NTP pyrophosphatase (non-canonical NTP hydrolase)